MKCFWVCVAVFVALFTGRARAQKEPLKMGPLRVGAAADLKFALDEFIGQFEKAHPQAKVQATYGSSGSLFAQIDNGAPFDVFLSADAKYPRQLIVNKKAAPKSLFLYAVGRLVLWVPKSSPLDVKKLGIKALLDDKARKIAIANPQHAPYGRAAEEALKSLGVYQQVKHKLVLGENIAQTAQFVQSGGADAGLIALSLAIAPPMQKTGRYWAVPLSAFSRLEQGGVILNSAKNGALAQQFRAELTGNAGRKLLQSYGFILPNN